MKRPAPLIPILCILSRALAPQSPVADAPVHFRWAAGGILVRPPLASGGLVYCVSEDRSVSALDEEGRILFRSDFRLSKRALMAPAEAGALLIADGNRLIRLNRAGKPGFIVEFQAGIDATSPAKGTADSIPIGEAMVSGVDDVTGAPVEGWDGRLFILQGGGLACVSVTGAVRWRIGLDVPVSAGPVLLGDGSVAVGFADGSLRVFDPYSREMGYPRGGGARVRALAAGEGGVAVLRADGSLGLALPDGSARCLAAGARAFCPARDGGWIILGEDGVLRRLGADGLTAWSVSAGRVYDRIKAYPGRVYLLGPHDLASFTESGVLLKEMHVRNNAVAPELSEGGIVYACGLDWIVYAYRFDTDRPLDYGRAPAPSAGTYGLMAYDREALEWELGIQDGLSQAALLDSIQAKLASALIGPEEPRIASALAAIALSRIDAEAGYAPRARANYPQERARACALLGALGSRESRQVLALVMARDGEDAVRAAAAEALGDIGWDGDGFSLASIRASCGLGYQPGSERLLAAAAGAIRRILAYEGFPVSDDGLATLIRISEYPAPPFVRARALEALRSAMNR